MDESMETDQVYLDETVEESDEEQAQPPPQIPDPVILLNGVQQEVIIVESESETELDEDERSGGAAGEDRLEGEPANREEGDHRPRGPTPNQSSRPDTPTPLSDQEDGPDSPANSVQDQNAPARMDGACVSMVTDENQNRSVPPPVSGGGGDAGQEDEEEAECCPICFEPWTNSGSHRLSSLKCGHLFGLSCIEKWLKGQGGKCPHCNTTAKKKDIRLIYAKALKAVDTVERDRALEALERERSARQQAELESAQSRLIYQSAMEECRKLQQELAQYRGVNSVLQGGNRGPPPVAAPALPAAVVPGGVPPSVPAGSYSLERTVRISEGGGCRVLGFCPQQSLLCISQPSSSPLFPGFGVKKLSCLDWRTMQYVAVHSKPIRDIAFNPTSPQPFMLTASIDKSVKVTSLTSNTCVQTYNCLMPVWSCCWNSDDCNYFYAGQQNGTVSVFDMRNTTDAVQHINLQASRSPAVSLQYVPRKQGQAFSSGGLLLCQLDKCYFYEQRSPEHYKMHALPSDGALTCLSLEESSRHLLLTFRPSLRHPSVRHQLCRLESGGAAADPAYQNCHCRPLHTFQGGRTQKLLSRNRLVAHPGGNGNLLVCGCDENTQSVQLWDATTGACVQRLRSDHPVLDLCPLQLADDHYLVTLTEKQALLHKWS